MWNNNSLACILAVLRDTAVSQIHLTESLNRYCNVTDTNKTEFQPKMLQIHFTGRTCVGLIGKPPSTLVLQRTVPNLRSLNSECHFTVLLQGSLRRKAGINLLLRICVNSGIETSALRRRTDLSATGSDTVIARTFGLWIRRWTNNGNAWIHASNRVHSKVASHDPKWTLLCCAQQRNNGLWGPCSQFLR